MKQETIDRLNNAVIGDKIETKKYEIIVVSDVKENPCLFCHFRKENADDGECKIIGIKCYSENTIDKKNHIFKRFKK
jgi:hypothetical protein